jgi:polyhydroxyalkanoate synthesis regulator phasin
MSTIGRMLELSIASQNPDHPIEELARRQSIQTLPNPAKRVGAFAMHRFSALFPRSAQSLLRYDAGLVGIEYLGYGREATVYRSGDNVIKTIRASADLNEEERQTLVRNIDHEYAQAKQWLPDFMPPQVAHVNEHPLGGTSRTVQIVQSYRPFLDDVTIFQTNTTRVDAEDIDDLRQRFPGIEDPLTDFVDCSYQLASETGFWPDTNGVNNLVLTDSPDPEVQLIDSRTLNASSARISALIDGQLRALRLALLETA